MKKEKIKSISFYTGIFICFIPAVLMEMYPADIGSFFRILQVAALICGSLGIPKVIGILESFLNSKFSDKWYKQPLKAEE